MFKYVLTIFIVELIVYAIIYGIHKLFIYIRIKDELREIKYFNNNEDNEDNEDIEEIKKIIDSYKKK